MRQFKPKLKVAKISFLSPLHIRSRVYADTGLLSFPCSALNLRDAIGPLPRPAIAIPSPARRRLLTSLAGVASPQGSDRRAGKEFPAQAFPPAAPFRRKALAIFPAGWRPRPPNGSRVLPDTGLLCSPCSAGKGSGSEKRMTFASGCAIIFRNDMKEAEK